MHIEGISCVQDAYATARSLPAGRPCLLLEWFTAEVDGYKRRTKRFLGCWALVSVETAVRSNSRALDIFSRLKLRFSDYNRGLQFLPSDYNIQTHYDAIWTAGDEAARNF